MSSALDKAAQEFIRAAYKLGAANGFVSQVAVGSKMFPQDAAFSQSVGNTVKYCKDRKWATTTVDGTIMLTNLGIEVAESNV